MLKIFFVMLILLTGCVKDYDFNPIASLVRYAINEKK